MKNMIPVVMAGVLGIYGLIVSVIISQKVSFGDYEKYVGYAHFASGLACGLSSLGIYGLIVSVIISQ